MKQRREGDKIQNWHRPLGRNQLRQRYVRHRYDDPEAESAQDHSMQCDVDVDECWDYFNPNYCIYCGRPDTECQDFYEAYDEIRTYQVEQILTEIVGKRQPLFRSEWAKDERRSGESRQEKRSCNDVALDEPLIPQKLAAHIENVWHKLSSDDFASKLRESIGDSQNVDILNRASDLYGYAGLAKRICLFAPFWIRTPRTWDESGKRSLLDHLFVVYDVPEFLYGEWFRGDDEDVWYNRSGFFKWACWFIVLAQGGSLKQAARVFGWNIFGQFQHSLSSLPEDVSAVEACICAEIMRLGGSQVEVARIMSHPAFVIDPTEVSASESHTVFWRATVRWLIANRNALNDDEANLVLNWAMHEYTETIGATQRFSWRGRSPRATIERSREYRRQQDRPWSAHKWASRGWDWEINDNLKLMVVCRTHDR